MGSTARTWLTSTSSPSYPVHYTATQVVSIPCAGECRLFSPRRVTSRSWLHRHPQSLARALGFEPKLSVLETDVLPLTLRPPPSIF